MSGNGVRDRQRQQVYDAEQLVRGMFERADGGTSREVRLHGSTITLPIERRFATVSAIEEYLRLVLQLDAIRTAFPRATAPIRVRTRGGATAAHYDYATATMAIPESREGRWALRELVVLHELAHHLEDPAAEEAAHGGAFVARTLEVVDIVMGPEAAFVLRAAYAGTGARMN